jgi:hypothetical protein
MNLKHELIENYYNNKICQNYYYWHDQRGQYPKKIANAAAFGSVLHQMLLQEQLTFQEFAAGFAFIKLHALVMRSKGINNRVRSYCQNWEQLYGAHYDDFCAPKLESLWQKLLKILAHTKHNKEILLALVMPTTNSFNYSTVSTKSALSFLNDFWKACDKTVYKKQVANLLISQH